MKRIFTVIAAVAALAFFVSSCRTVDNGPAETAKRALECIMNDDIDGYVDTYNFADDERKEMAELFEKTLKDEMKENKGITSYEIRGTEFNEAADSARVSVHIVYGNETEEDMTMDMVKVDGQWLQYLKK